MTSAAGGLFSHVEQGPPDPILGIAEAYKKSTNPKKLNLGVGAYRTEEGKPLVLEAVRRAEQAVVSNPDHEYLPITGIPEFNALSARLAFGEDSSVIRENCNATVQALSGTGSLRVGAEFLARHYPVRTVLLPSPTWPSHNKIFPLAGVADVRAYRYFKPSSRGLDYEGMLEDLRKAPEGSILLLHACAHNPTGVDPSLDQWRGILEVAKEKKFLPFFDSAYQGFASGDLERDATAIRMFADEGMEMLLAQSYAKNMGLYGERVGALTVVARDAAIAERVESQLKLVIRPMFSNPPRFGAAIVVKVLQDPELYALWRKELKGMADRINGMRTLLFQELQRAGAPGKWSHIVEQIGMFSFTGLSKPQVEYLTAKWHVYMTLDGRISMAGLNQASCRYLAEGIADAIRACP
ncbi:hypothetical protein WJX81_006018 [Elliptochloris bilobata]|uniref:Aspartate aminotransferase n=1 Tax=Elliptochloris bilobata TaxID=381761 RepID=A0AAW1QZ86_9CHLO